MPGLLFCVFYFLLSSLQSRFFFVKGIFPARMFHRIWIKYIKKNKLKKDKLNFLKKNNLKKW